MESGDNVNAAMSPPMQIWDRKMLRGAPRLVFSPSPVRRRQVPTVVANLVGTQADLGAGSLSANDAAAATRPAARANNVASPEISSATRRRLLDQCVPWTLLQVLWRHKQPVPALPRWPRAREAVRIRTMVRRTTVQGELRGSKTCTARCAHSTGHSDCR